MTGTSSKRNLQRRHKLRPAPQRQWCRAGPTSSATPRRTLGAQPGTSLATHIACRNASTAPTSSRNAVSVVVRPEKFPGLATTAQEPQPVFLRSIARDRSSIRSRSHLGPQVANHQVEILYLKLGGRSECPWHDSHTRNVQDAVKFRNGLARPYPDALCAQ